MLTQKTVIIALGGSIICPQPGRVDELRSSSRFANACVINVSFLKRFKGLILKYLGKGFRFIIIAGGGKVCRVYQRAAAKVVELPDEDMDWLGIHATRLNAHLLRTIFRKEAYPVILDDPHKPIKNNWKVLIAAGWRPGWSTDYISVLLAKRFKTSEIIDAGNIPFVYNKDLQKYKNAYPIKKISWKNYRKLIGSRWIPGLAAPIDPIAAKLAQKLNLRALIVKGTEINNFDKILAGKKFKGTIIEP
ncbi:MAG: UMP kinase [Candidatus Nealsonbacteria bacterium CG23_combo_of_CG06-09_8_20_14_all_39_25]|uniref:UMP kinase n=4 Tax=Bacteria candidate phyla TaxID=1783234 RepID=A0A2G9YU78_9BACT|nr:MAG: UMP kinase [Candidatus Nealsonbacteria bacterium CG23_combo_of_CG06-09_8_20_14_all_39_25]PIQ98633.1 MAG: UMP kinase [Candidatus Nealsonbacteria bacterium CG11_big_fil_rev_8_21_14_0_20_39_9]PIZ88031.1 MAG: UMP kinase [Candidatus Nealsonbacteria bacterium CG_4_10_14_0_2_um_filter_39_15]PJC68156.1 MAG: UMP kinase [candidate division WWE3 bacterium CG_4_8_14_3_um_filter_42_11]